MKKLLFILFAAIAVASCNNYEEFQEQQFQDCAEKYNHLYDTVHVQSAPNAAQDLYNLGYDTTKALIILPGGMQ